MMSNPYGMHPQQQQAQQQQGGGGGGGGHLQGNPGATAFFIPTTGGAGGPGQQQLYQYSRAYPAFQIPTADQLQLSQDFLSAQRNQQMDPKNRTAHASPSAAQLAHITGDYHRIGAEATRAMMQHQQLQQLQQQQQQQQRHSALLHTAYGGASMMSHMPAAGVMQMSAAAQQQQQQQQGGSGNIGVLGHGGSVISAASAPNNGGGVAAPSHYNMAGGNSAATPAGTAAGGAATAPKGKIEVEDEYGLKSLLKVLTAPPAIATTPSTPLPNEAVDAVTGLTPSQLQQYQLNFAYVSRGFDITQLDLLVSQQDWLHPTLATLALDDHEYFILPEFKIPDCYKKPRPKSLSMKSFNFFKEETLYYIFYSMPRDVLHLAAARALYERGWRYQKKQQQWFRPLKKEDGAPHEEVVSTALGQTVFTGAYEIFNPKEWKFVKTGPNYTILAADVEDQAVLVSAMEEAARQQSLRQQAKTVAK